MTLPSRWNGVVRAWVPLLLVWGAPAWAAEPDATQVQLSYQALVASHRSYDFVGTGDHLSMVRAGVGRSFGLTRAAVDVELAYLHGGTDAPVHQRTTAGFELHSVELAGSYRLRLYRYFEPFVRASVSGEAGTLRLEGASVQHQTVLRPAVGAMAGVRVPFYLPRHGVPLGALRIGVGYTVRPEFAFDRLQPSPPARSELPPIASGALPVGALQLSGISYEVGLALQF